MTPVWQKRRSRFNHDWLKNQLLPAMGCWLNILDGELEDPEFVRSFRHSCLASWVAHRDDVLQLIRDFEPQMSPSRLIEQSPLSRLGAADRLWLIDLVHKLWLARYAVPKLVTDALCSVEAVDQAYERLQRRIQHDPETWSACSERPFRNEWAEFRVLYQRLGRSIEAFPSEVKVV